MLRASRRGSVAQRPSLTVAGAIGVRPLRLQMVSPARFELTAPGLGILCSILLSYGDYTTIFSTGFGACQYAGADRANKSRNAG